jgi:hypothetical protein
MSVRRRVVGIVVLRSDLGKQRFGVDGDFDIERRVLIKGNRDDSRGECVGARSKANQRKAYEHRKDYKSSHDNFGYDD